MDPAVSQLLTWDEAQHRDWTSSEGLAELKNIVTPLLPYVPRDFQLYDSAHILRQEKYFILSRPLTP